MTTKQYKVIGDIGTQIPHNAVKQMDKAMSVPVAMRGALLPDAHYGYSVPIGAVVSLNNAISPAYIGYDISCMMSMTVFDISVDDFMNHRENFSNSLRGETNFGVGGSFKGNRRRQSYVMDLSQWDENPLLKRLKAKAANQLGTSGGGNHFADLMIGEHLENGTEFVALVTHSGSRGTGHQIATYYSKIADEIRPDGIEKGYGWLDLDRAIGQEYLTAMNLMGAYASANHDEMHASFMKSAGLTMKMHYANRHNFAWLWDDGEVVHRKGATPADNGQFGIIPGTSGSYSYLVRGLGYEDTLRSSSHGAGRPFSRTEAKRQHDDVAFKNHMKEQDILFYSIAADETISSYKDIEKVMELQDGLLLERVARMRPVVVIMGGRR